MQTLKVKPGDLVRVPIAAEGDFLVCRVISEENVNAHLVEIFRRVWPGDTKKVDPTQLGDRLFRPVFLKFMFTKIPKWKVLQSDVSYDKSMSGYERIQIAFDSSLPPELWQAGRTRSSNINELQGLEPSIVWFPEKILKRVQAHLEGSLGPDDLFPV
jgi:hypothetical protein